MAKFVIVLLFTLFTPVAFSQEARIPERIIAIAEQLADDESDPGAADLFAERLFELSEDPVMINSGDEKEICRLFFLTDFQVKVLADYVKTSGRIVSLFEIANIPGFDKESAEILIPFITLEYKISSISDPVRLRHTLLTNLLYKSITPGNPMPGSSWKILTKYKITAGGFAAGFTAEKDPGEKLLSGKPPLPDFLSGYLTYKGSGVIKRIVIGDYSARFGQGTNINTGIRTGLSLTTQGYLAGRSEIRPYTSTDENNFFRGAAAELSFKKIDLSVFISSNKIDATLNDTAGSPLLSIKNFYKTGLHNSSSALSKKDAVSETGYGVNLIYNLKNLRTGITWTETGFSLPVIPDLNNPVYRYGFTGSKNKLFTIYYNSLIKRFILYGELSVSGLNKYAFVQGLTFRPSGRLNINLLFRNYSPGYMSFHGNGPSGGSVDSNEYGILGNFTFEAARFLFISAGSDMRYYPWLRYRCSAPSIAKRHEIRIKYLPSQKLSAMVLYNFRYSMADRQDENSIPGQDEIITQSLRGSVRYAPTEYLTLITRADYKLVNPSKSKGLMLLQDINFKLRRFPVSIWMRYSIFNTGSFDSGIYTWENDLINSFSIPVLYGTGNRVYIMASCKIADRIDLRIKYGSTTTMVINSRMKENNEFKIQFRIMI
ncbi:MAG: hypothetical protein C0408_07445 [Odoribacter sp.]|nr:hypothetical protein [Odoribacter sp.]